MLFRSVTGGNWRAVLKAVARVGEPLTMLYSRRGMIGTAVAVPSAGQGSIRLRPVPGATAEQVALRDGWLATACAKQQPDAAGDSGNAAPSEPRM